MTTPLEEAKALIAEARCEEAARLLGPLTNCGNAEADYLFGSILFNSNEDVIPREEAIAALRRAAALDHPEACYWASVTSLDADGSICVYQPLVDRDLLVHAAELGCTEAQRRVGCLHVDGEDGFPKDLEVTRHWYARAAEQGEAYSQYDLGWMMLAGEGGPTDQAAGLRWLETCAMRNEPLISASAADFLATVFEDGLYGLPADPIVADQWRRRERELQEAEAARAREKS